MHHLFLRGLQHKLQVQYGQKVQFIDHWPLKHHDILVGPFDLGAIKRFNHPNLLVSR